jgi:hypothetical protein
MKGFAASLLLIVIVSFPATAARTVKGQYPARIADF